MSTLFYSRCTPVYAPGVDPRPAKILEKAERRIAAVAAELVAARRYDEARPVMDLAAGLRALCSKHLDVAPAPAAAPEPAAPHPPISPRPAAGRAGYPRFALDGATLVKIGWSRREKAEYEHRSPLGALRAVAGAADAAADARGRFTTDDLMPVADADGRPLPSYQSYLCLAFLRRAGLVGAAGRSHYHIARPGTLARDAADAAERLPGRRAMW